MHQSKFETTFLILTLFISSCSTQIITKQEKDDESLEIFRIDPSQEEIRTYCSDDDFQKKIVSKFKLGDIICAKYSLKHRSGYKLKMNYKILNKNSNNSYKKGHWELQIFKKGKLGTSIIMRKEHDPAWHDVSFVRIRNKKYFAKKQYF